MVRYVWCRPGHALLTVSPLLLLLTSIFGMGLLVLPVLVWAAQKPGQGALWFLLAIHGVLAGIGTYACRRAARAHEVRCRRDGSRIVVASHSELYEGEWSDFILEVGRRRYGSSSPVTVHVVVLRARGVRKEWMLHGSLTRWSAERAALRVQTQLGLSA